MLTTSCVMVAMASAAAFISCCVARLEAAISSSLSDRFCSLPPIAASMRSTKRAATRSMPSTCSRVAATMKLSIERCTGSSARRMLCSICVTRRAETSSTAVRR